MFHLEEDSTRRFVYAPLHLGHGELLSLRAAAGFCICAVDALLWITVDRDARDLFVPTGGMIPITSNRHVLVAADRAARVVLSGTATRATSIERVRIDGARVAVVASTAPARAFGRQPAWTGAS